MYILKEKNEAFDIFQTFQAQAESQTGQKLLCLHIDNGGEYDSNRFNQFCKELGIRRQYTVPYTPEQNGIAECRNRTLQEMARAMIKQAGLSTPYWVEAVTAANYLLNRLPSKAVPGSTHLMSSGGAGSLVFLIFGFLDPVPTFTFQNQS